MTRAWRQKSVALGLVLASSVLALLLGELAARLVVHPGDFLTAQRIEHPVLGHRLEPNTTGHDALGFRNRRVPERADIVAIGDSVTYGVGAARDDSWPHQTGTLLQERVYSMALGGYGPLEYLYLAEQEAKLLRPRLLLVGFNFANDLIDAYDSAYQKPHWRDWREPGAAHAGGSEYQRAWVSQPKKRFAALRDWLSMHSVLYSMLRVVLLSDLASWERDAQQSEAAQRMSWTDPSARAVGAVFMPRLRLSVVDPQLPSVQEGLRITKRAFVSLQSGANAQGTRLLVVLIPTKERVYCLYLRQSGTQMPDALARTCEGEERVKQELAQFLAAHTIAYVDVTPALEEQVQQHVQIYPKGEDSSHPQAAGYRVIARTVYAAVNVSRP
jgi:lysophospholipase L1-like esterase